MPEGYLLPPPPPRPRQTGGEGGGGEPVTTLQGPSHPRRRFLEHSLHPAQVLCQYQHVVQKLYRFGGKQSGFRHHGPAVVCGLAV